MAAQTAITRVESFPFDSKADGYDADGYPVYDRAVGAAMLRSVFEKYFSDGVFGEPADALQIKKAATGLAVTINPGIFIINGAMGGWRTSSDPATITLTQSAPQGNTAYGIMLRYDENDTEGTGRSLSVRVVAGDAASSPQPPAPDQTSPGVMEYRLGYVVVPSGATNMTNATVHNEKGSAVCPYAAPFERIDLSEIVSDARGQATYYLNAFIKFLDENKAFLDSAIDGTVAGNLQDQIDQLNSKAFDVDEVTLESNDGVVSAIMDTHTGVASFKRLFDVDTSLAVVAFNAELSNIVADDKASTVFIWEFPDDSELISGYWDSSEKLYYSEVNS